MSLLTNLISYWSLSESSGNAIDAHSSNTLTETGGSVASATGKISTGRDLENGTSLTDNTAQYFRIASNAALNVADQDFTWSVWLNLESKGNYRAILNKADVAVPTALVHYSYYLIYDTAADRFTLSVTNGVSSATLTANTLGSPSVATWYHIVAWHDSVANQLGMKINNVAETPVSYSGGSYNTASYFNLGAQPTYPAAFATDGIIDEVGFWKDRVLSASDISELYNGGAGLAYPFTAAGNRRRRALVAAA